MKRLLAAVVIGAGVSGGPVTVSAQCMLANPSFELAGSNPAVFAGWNQFGPVGSSASAFHGAGAARVTGPNTGGWAVSGFWQSLDCAPGQRWSASVWVRHETVDPLAGQSRALLNIEWRDAGGNLISYESHTAADASTPKDAWRSYSVQSQAAPAGTASIHFLLGVLQGPTDPTPRVLFDIPACLSLGPPTHESLQWNDFPGGRTVNFGGRTWRVKGPGFYGPGPNLFDDSAGAVWVDAWGRLHLSIRNIGGSWYSSEVTLTDALGYGDYVFTTRGRLDLLDPNAVLGLFLWEYGDCYDTAYLWWNPYNEIDIEFSRWGNPAGTNAQFVAQPWDAAGNLFRFTAAFGDDEVTSHAMRWLPQRVEYRSWRGGPDAEGPANMIASWTYEGPHLPRPETPRVHLNLWQLATPAAGQEVVFDAFTFRPACVPGWCVVGVTSPASPAVGLSAAPNPVVSGTAIRYSVPVAGDVELSVLDITGRRVRRLASGAMRPGEQVVHWNGRDDDGRRVPPGVYLFLLRAPGVVETKRLTVLE